MRVINFVFIALIFAIDQVIARGFLVHPRPRLMPHRFLNHFPVGLRRLGREGFFRRPLGELRVIAGNSVIPTGMFDLPCGGVPLDPTSAIAVVPGGRVPIRWSIGSPVLGSCAVNMICPETAVSQELWRGACGDRVGQFEQLVTLPHTLRDAEFGQCFLQWRMDAAGDTTVGCTDLVVSGGVGRFGHGRGHGFGHRRGHVFGHGHGHEFGHGRGHEIGHERGNEVGHGRGNEVGHERGNEVGHGRGQLFRR